MKLIKKTGLMLLVFTMVLSCMAVSSHAVSTIPEDTLIGIWERYGDGAEGTQIQIEKQKEKDLYNAILLKPYGTLVDLGFLVNDVKWKDVGLYSQNVYRGYDLYRFEGGGTEYVSVEITVLDSKTMKLVRLNEIEGSIIGSYQHWRKINSASTAAGNRPKTPVVNVVDNNDKIVKGKAGPGLTVMIKKNKTVIGQALADQGGNFSVGIGIQKAAVLLEVTAIDGKGQESLPAKIVVKDVIAPAAAVVNKARAGDKVIKGKAEAGATVIVKVGSKTIGTASADSKGTFSVKIPAQKANIKLDVVVKDKSGNVSKVTRLTVAK